MADGDGTPSGGSANSGGSEGGVQATLFTQDQVNSFNAQAKRGAVGSFFKELGFEDAPDAETIKSAFQAAAEHKKLKDGEKGDVERLNTELSTTKEKAARVPTLETTILQQQLAGTEGLPVRFWKFVEGKTEDEIKESIEGLKKDLNLTDGGDDDGSSGRQQQQVGTGARPPAPNQQQGRTGSGGAPGKTLSAGREAYEAKHKATKE